jgi:hypothetical protein
MKEFSAAKTPQQRKEIAQKNGFPLFEDLWKFLTGVLSESVGTVAAETVEKRDRAKLNRYFAKSPIAPNGAKEENREIDFADILVNPSSDKDENLRRVKEIHKFSKADDILKLTSDGKLLFNFNETKGDDFAKLDKSVTTSEEARSSFYKKYIEPYPVLKGSCDWG